MYHISFIHSSVEDFNNFGKILKSKLAGLNSNPIFNFLRNFCAIFQSSCNPTDSQMGSSFSLSSPVLGIICLFDDSHPGWCEVVSHRGFDLHFPDDSLC